MATLDQRTDFQDDGGTRAWRANQATYGRVIDVGRPARRPVGLLGLIIFILAWGSLGLGLTYAGCILAAWLATPNEPWIGAGAWGAFMAIIFIGHFRYFVLGYGRAR